MCAFTCTSRPTGSYLAVRFSKILYSELARRRLGRTSNFPVYRATRPQSPASAEHVHPRRKVARRHPGVDCAGSCQCRNGMTRATRSLRCDALCTRGDLFHERRIGSSDQSTRRSRSSPWITSWRSRHTNTHGSTSSSGCLTRSGGLCSNVYNWRYMLRLDSERRF